jgi:hypothetical protein
VLLKMIEYFEGVAGTSVNGCRNYRYTKQWSAKMKLAWRIENKGMLMNYSWLHPMKSAIADLL